MLNKKIIDPENKLILEEVDRWLKDDSCFDEKISQKLSDKIIENINYSNSSNYLMVLQEEIKRKIKQLPNVDFFDC